MANRFTKLSQLLMVSLLLFGATCPAEDSKAIGSTNSNRVLAVVNGTVAAATSGAVAYSGSHQFWPAVAVAVLQGGIFGAWQWNIEPAVQWMQRPFRWDKTSAHFPTGTVKLTGVVLVCTAALACVMKGTGLTHDPLLSTETLKEIVVPSAKYLLAATPVYETVKLLSTGESSRTRRFLLNLAPFTMEVVLNAATAASLLGISSASDAAFGATFLAGSSGYLFSALPPQKAKERLSKLTHSCLDLFRKVI